MRWEGEIAEPIFTKDADGTVGVLWPVGDPPFCLITRDAVKGFVANSNRILALTKIVELLGGNRADRREARRLLAELTSA